MKNETSKPRTSTNPGTALSTPQRLDRLERVVVRALLSLPLLGSQSNPAIAIEGMPAATKTALHKRFYQFSKDEDLVEAEYALKFVLDVCADDIVAAEVAEAVAADKAAGVILDQKQAAASEAKQTADSAAKAAQEEIDAIEADRAKLK